MNKLLLVVLIATLLFSGCKKDKQEPSVVTPPKVLTNEITTATRGVWVPTLQHTDFLSSKQSIETWMTTLKDMGFNTVFVVTWTGGRTTYPSQVAQNAFGVNIDERLSGRDPLKEVCDVAKTKDMKVYAWFEYGFASDYNSSTSLEIIKKNPQWAAIGQDGRTVNKNGFNWMNALDTNVQNFVFNMMMEVVDKYEVTGIQGDDRLPAMPTEAGYDSVTVKRYKAEKGVNPPGDPKDATWVAWRADILNNFMKRIYTEAKKRKPNIQISMSPSAYPFALTEYLQDWPTWVKNGWVDMIAPQCYRYDIAAYSATLKQQLSYMPADKKNIFYPGVLLSVGKTYVAPSDLLQKMVSENRLNGVGGEVFFYNDGVLKSRSFFDYVYKK
jgi:uncharacterized lipoprotein YddW (UPF0748 family)